jgi:membrane-associated protease RseP (regulator of RpoE activity)
MLEFSSKLGDILVSVVLMTLLLIWIILQLIDQEKFEKRGVERSPLTLIIRSKKGLEVIDRVAKKRRRFFKRLGSLAVVISIPLILLVVISLFFSASHILKTPDAPPGIAPLLPEGVVEIEGAPSIPLEYWFIAIVSILVFHEIMHGLMARAEDIPLKSLGIFALTFIPLGAFVEPNDEVLEKKPAMSQLRVYAAGSMGNFIATLLGGILLAVLVFGLTPIAFQSAGITIYNVTAASPADLAGVQTNITLLGIDDQSIKNVDDFQEALPGLKPGVPVTLRTSGGDFEVVPEKREGFTNGFIGIAVLPEMQVKPFVANTVGEERAFSFYGVLVEGLGWIVLLNLLVGLTNLLPIIPLDGGRIFALFTKQAAPKKAKEITTLVYLFLLALVFINAGPLFGLF